MASPFKRRVVIVDGNQEARDSLRLIVNSTSKFTVTSTYGDCENALNRLHQDKPDIVLMDIELPGMNGIQGAKSISEKSPHTYIIIVSTAHDFEIVSEALKAGVSGYIIKNGHYQEILMALEEILKGGAPMSSKIARMIIENLHVNPNSPLSKRETQILKLMGQGKTYTQIAEELIISKDTTKAHIKNIYLKLHVNSKSQAIEKATTERLI